MPDNSGRTSNLGPRVSHVTTKAYNGPGHYLSPSWLTFEIDGPLNSDGGANFASAVTMESGSILDLAEVDPVKFSNITTASPTSVFIADGHFSIVSHSANSMVIAIRSGATTYRWTNDAGGVL